MMKMIDEETGRFEVNTKGICILCFSNCSKEPFISQKTGTTITPFVGYLDVNVKKICAFLGCEDQADEISNDLELVVTLCDKCEQVGNKFDSLLEQFEKIKSQLEDCCKEWHQLMDEGAKDVRKVQEYRSRMKTGNPLGMLHAAVAEKLRKETISKCLEKVTPKNTSRSQSHVPDKGGSDHFNSFQALTPGPNLNISEPSDDLNFDDEVQFILATSSQIQPSAVGDRDEGQLLLPVSPQDSLSADSDLLCHVTTDPDPLTGHFSTSVVAKPNVTLGPPSAGTTLSQLLDNINFDNYKFPESSTVVHKLTTIEGSTYFQCKFCGLHYRLRRELIRHTVEHHTFEVFSKYLREDVSPEALKQIFDQFQNCKNVLPGTPTNYGCTHCNFTTVNFKNRFNFPFTLKRHNILNHLDILFHKLRNEFGAADNEDYQCLVNSKQLLTDAIFKTSLEDKRDDFEHKKKKRRLSRVKQPEQTGDSDNMQMSKVEVAQRKMTPEQPLTSQQSEDLNFNDGKQFLLLVSSEDSLLTDQGRLGDVQREPDPRTVHFSTSTSQPSDLEHHLVYQQIPMVGLQQIYFVTDQPPIKTPDGNINADVAETVIPPSAPALNESNSEFKCTDCDPRSPDQSAPLDPHLVHLAERPNAITCKFCQKQFQGKSDRDLVHHSILTHAYDVFSKYLPGGVTREDFITIFDQFRNEAKALPESQFNYGCCHCKYTTVNNKKPHAIKHHNLLRHTELLLQHLRKQFGPLEDSIGYHEGFEKSRKDLWKDIFKTSVELDDNSRKRETEDQNDFEPDKKRFRTQVEQPEPSG